MLVLSCFTLIPLSAESRYSEKQLENIYDEIGTSSEYQTQLHKKMSESNSKAWEARKIGRFDLALMFYEKGFSYSNDIIKSHLQTAQLISICKSNNYLTETTTVLEEAVASDFPLLNLSRESQLESLVESSLLACKPQKSITFSNLLLSMQNNKREISNESDILAQRASGKILLNDLRGAEIDLHKSLSLQDKLFVWGQLADLYGAEKKYDKAINIYEKILERINKTDRNKWIPLLKLATLHALNGDADKSKEYFNQVKTGSSFEKGLFHSASKNYLEALIDLSESIHQLHSLDWRQETLARLERALCYAKVGKYEKAKEDIERVSKYFDECPYYKEKAKEISKLIDESIIDNKPIPERWAILVGISKFADKSIPALRYAAKDAKDLKDYLIQNCGYKPSNVKLLVDENATRQKILENLADKWLPSVVGTNDTLLLFISSHGTPAKRDIGALNYFVAHDTQKDHLFTSGIAMQYIVSTIDQRLKCRRTLLITDTCYSGATSGGIKSNAFGNLIPSDYLMNTGQLVITSCSPNERSWESKRYKNGVFTKHFINTIDVNKPVTDIRKLLPQLQQNVSSEVSKDQQISQTPQMAGSWSGSGILTNLSSN